MGRVPEEMANSVASSTSRGYESHWRRWQQFTVDNGVVSLPADEKHLAAYFIHLMDNSRSMGPALGDRAAIYHYHRLLLTYGPRSTESTMVAMTMTGLGKKWEKAKVKALPLTAELWRGVMGSLMREDPAASSLANHRLAALVLCL